MAYDSLFPYGPERQLPPPPHPATTPFPPTPDARYPPPMNDTHHSNNAPAPSIDTAPLHRPLRPTRRPRRKRGAQPGNQNARKHGVYSALKPAEHAEEALLNTLRSSNLWPHIDAMRNAVFALLEDPAAPPDPRPQRRHRPPRNGESREKAPPPPLMRAVQGRIYVYEVWFQSVPYLETKHPDRHREAFERDILRHPDRIVPGDNPRNPCGLRDRMPQN